EQQRVQRRHHRDELARDAELALVERLAPQALEQDEEGQRAEAAASDDQQAQREVRHQSSPWSFVKAGWPSYLKSFSTCTHGAFAPTRRSSSAMSLSL